MVISDPCYGNGRLWGCEDVCDDQNVTSIYTFLVKYVSCKGGLTYVMLYRRLKDTNAGCIFTPLCKGQLMVVNWR